MRKDLLLLVLLVLGALSTWGQGALDGYMKGRHFTDVALTYSFESYDTYFFGTEAQDISVTTQTVNLYIAHGVSDQLDLIASIPYMWTDSLNSGLQDAILAIRFRNKRKALSNGGYFNIMTSVGVGFPISNYPTTTAQPIGIKAISFLPRFILQYEKNGYFLQTQTGVDFRLSPTGLVSIPWIIRTGYSTGKIYADLWFDLFRSINAGVDNSVTGGEGASWGRIGGTFYVQLNQAFGVFTGGAYNVSGRNIGQAGRVNAGLVYKWDRRPTTP